MKNSHMNVVIQVSVRCPKKKKKKEFAMLKNILTFNFNSAGFYHQMAMSYGTTIYILTNTYHMINFN